MTKRYSAPKKITWYSRTLGSAPGENRSTGIYWVVSTRRAIQAAFLLSLAALGGCSIAPTSLSCGTDADASYVTLENLKDNSPQTIKTYGELCAFNYEASDNET